MGLDVYLYRYDRSPAEIKAQEEAYEHESELLFTRLFGEAKYETLTEEQKATYRAATDVLEKQHGVGEWGEAPGKTKIEENSKVYPEHYFKVGYFRSSYNGSGFNHVVRDRIGVSLDDIFPSEKDEYVRTVDWGAALKLARDARDEFAAYLAKNGNYLVFDVEAESLFGKPSVASEKDALAVFNAERERKQARPGPPGFEHYSSRDGHFFMGDPVRIVALIPGTRSILKKVPCVYAIAETAGEEPGLKWYLQALEIVVETCEWVLGQPDPKQYLLHWSG